MFKTRKFQSWARVGATYLPPSLPVSLSCSLCVSLFPSSPFPSVSLFAVCLLFVATSELDQLSKIVCTPQCTLCLSLSLSLSHTGADIRLPEKLFRRTKRLPGCQTYLFCHKLLHKQAQCNFNQFYGTFICQAPEPAPACLPACPTTTCRHPLGHPLHFLPLSPIHW